MLDKTLQSRNPYHKSGLPPQLLRSVVIYMDVLRYTEMAKRANDTGNNDLFFDSFTKHSKKAKIAAGR